jgi:hypothetical protein
MEHICLIIVFDPPVGSHPDFGGPPVRTLDV